MDEKETKEYLDRERLREKLHPFSELFEEQIRLSKPLTEKKILELSGTGTSFNTKFKPGDYLLFACFYGVGPMGQKQDFYVETLVQRDFLHIREHYICTDKTAGRGWPKFKLKEEK